MGNWKGFVPFKGRSTMGSMAKMAVFAVLGSAILIVALMIASHLNTAAG